MADIGHFMRDDYVIRSVLLTALNLLPSTATIQSDSLFNRLHNKTNSRHTSLDCITVIFAKVRDGLEIGRQTTQQPHQLNVALGFSF